MNENEPIASLTEISGSFSGQRLPRWRELPDLELYMDQVLALIERYLSGYPGLDEKTLTASMVNNYVKLGVMPAPQKKKYARLHLAHLIMICILKSSLPIAAIQKLLAAQMADGEPETSYDRFCDMFERTCGAVAECVRQLSVEDAGAGSLGPIYLAALRAQAEQALALKLYSLRFFEEEA